MIQVGLASGSLPYGRTYLDLYIQKVHCGTALHIPCSKDYYVCVKTFLNEYNIALSVDFSGCLLVFEFQRIFETDGVFLDLGSCQILMNL